MDRVQDPEVLFDSNEVEEMDEDQEGITTSTSICSGQLALRDNTLSLTMGWHVGHPPLVLAPEVLDELAAFHKEFLKYRCLALRDAFGHLKGVTGFRMDDNGDWGPHHEVGRPNFNKTCGVSMGYRWPHLDNPNWEELKTKFIEIFEPATLHGKVLCAENGTYIHIAGEFKLPEKGQSDA